MNEGLERFVKDTRSPLARLIGGAPVAHRVFAFGGGANRFGSECRWAVRALSADDRAKAVVDAVKWLTGTCGWDRADLYTEFGESVIDLESKVRMLAAALVDPADPAKPFAKDADELRRLLDTDEINRLFEELADFTDERSPLSKARDWKDVEGLLDALKKGWTPPTSLQSYDAASLRFIVRGLVARWSPPTRPSCSDTSPRSDASEPSTTDPAPSS